ncbi:hypothetical protein ACQ4PT_022656 [Festuca glaucescens]
MEVDGESYKSWAWWLDALQAMRRTYSIPMDAKEARICAETQDPKALRAAVEKARRMDRLEEERVAVDRWAKTKDPEAATYRRQLENERREMYRRMMTEEPSGDTEDWSEPCNYRSKWRYIYKGRRGTYEDTTDVPAMRFTDDDRAKQNWNVELTGTLQIFSFKVAAIAEELRWPLDVYGLIAIRDHLDRRRNIIYARARDNCQTITREDPYLKLVGPTRATVLSQVSDSVRFEVVLKVKSGSNESDDKDLSFLASKYRTFETNYSRVICRVGSSKLSKLQWRYGLLAKSVEATIGIQVIHGSWPNGCRGIFSASTTSLDGMKVTLLSLEDDKLPINIDGMINVSRHVVCVEIDGQLKISITTESEDGDQITIKDEIIFTPKESGRSSAILKVHSCQMKVIVAWSLVCCC